MWKIALYLLMLTGLVAAVRGDERWLFNQDFAARAAGKMVIEQDENFPEFFGAKFSPDSPIYQVPSSDRFNFIDDFGIEAVFRSDEIQDYRTILWKGDRSQNPQRIQFFVSTIDGKMEFKFKDAQGEWFNFITPQPVIFPGLWYHVIAKFQGGYAQIWVNGRACAVRNAYGTKPPMKTLVKNGDPLYIGSGNYGNKVGMYFCGVIREIRIVSPAAKLVVDPEQDAKWEARSFQQLLQKANAALLKSEKVLALVSQSPSFARLEAQKAELRRVYQQLQDAVKNAEYDSAKSLYAKLQKQQEAFRAQLQVESDRLGYHVFFKKLAGQADFAVATLPTGKGYRKTPQAFRRFEVRDAIAMRAAKGEVESFQIIPMAGEAATQIRMAFSGFSSQSTGKSLPDIATWGIIQEVSAAKTMLGNSEQDRQNYLGSWPDIILDGSPATIPLAANEATAVFFRVSVPPATPPGDYRGVITVSNATGEKQLTVKLHVYPFELPERNSIPVAFSFFKHFYSNWFGALTPEQNASINRFLLAYRLAPCNIYAGTLNPSLQEQKEFKLNFATAGYFSEEKPFSAEKLNALIEKYRKALKPVEAAGLEKQTYLYSFDEISCLEPKQQKEGFAVANQLQNRLKQEFPWLQRVQTSAPQAALLSAFDIWCPTFDYFDPSNRARNDFQKQGMNFWWYAADAPLKPYPNFFLGYPLNDSRVIMTMTYMNQINGILYWCINREWETNLPNKATFLANSTGWKPLIVSAFSKREITRNGMGNLLYPGPGGTLRPSLRLENLRDGVEDYELYKLLEQRIAKLEELHSPRWASLLLQAKKTLAVPPAVAVSVRSYDHDPHALMKHHDAVGDLIETIDRTLAETK